MRIEAAREPLTALIETVRKLRAPQGCPWDRAQTPKTLRPFVIEEAYEVLQALDNLPDELFFSDQEKTLDLKEELGDLLLQVLLHSQIASEHNAFDFSDVAQALNDKLIRRHPHVFGDGQANSPEAVIKQWEEIKKEEKSSKHNHQNETILSGIPKALPALERADKMIRKVSKVGFQWDSIQGPIDKVKEELREFLDELEQNPTANQEKRLEEEVGDLLFSICNVCSFLKIKPEQALRAFCQKFEERFSWVETRVRASKREWNTFSLEELDRFWEEAKSKTEPKRH
jgi:tetrapyrrole methylase family protein/MazG family protein